jgi:hypothetical protein
MVYGGTFTRIWANSEDGQEVKAVPLDLGFAFYPFTMHLMTGSEIS